MALPLGDPSERGGDDIEQSYLHQDPVSAHTGGDGHAETEGQDGGCDFETEFGGTLS